MAVAANDLLAASSMAGPAAARTPSRFTRAIADARLLPVEGLALHLEVGVVELAGEHDRSPEPDPGELQGRGGEGEGHAADDVGRLGGHLLAEGDGDDVGSAQLELQRGVDCRGGRVRGDGDHHPSVLADEEGRAEPGPGVEELVHEAADLRLDHLCGRRDLLRRSALIREGGEGSLDVGISGAGQRGFQHR